MQTIEELEEPIMSTTLGISEIIVNLTVKEHPNHMFFIFAVTTRFEDGEEEYVTKAYKGEDLGKYVLIQEIIYQLMLKMPDLSDEDFNEFENVMYNLTMQSKEWKKCLKENAEK